MSVLKSLSSAATSLLGTIITCTQRLALLCLLLALMPRIVTQQQAARTVGVTPRTVRNWISQGWVTGYRLPSGRAIRVDLEEVTAQLRVIPTKVPFGPKAKIVDLRNTVEAEPSQQAEQVNGEVDGQDTSVSEVTQTEEAIR